MQRNYAYKAAAFCLAAMMGLTGCAMQPEATGSSDHLRIVCTVFPEYDWVREVLGDHMKDAEVTYLLDNGADLHSYQPTAMDMAEIATCDLFVYVGGESEHWVSDALAEATNENMQTVCLMEVIGDAAKEEELKEGMQGEEEEEEGEEEEGPEYDEHVWLSLRNAQTSVNAIAEKLSVIDAANAADYAANAGGYCTRLQELDGKFRTLVDGAQNKTLIFGDRFPFRYFVDDYGLDYYAAFIGCSAETEASFETVIFLANKVDELGARTVYTIENSDASIAHTIVENTKTKDQQIATLNSIQSVTKQQISEGMTYLSLMEGNYTVLQDTMQ
ncbi:MAG: metal ABC transporter substrate-binding protein [Oscillospiraceae bacterium]|nr:metal ABC transporter substrate-binding protein [Oscillospiraceae bacterium]